MELCLLRLGLAHLSFLLVLFGAAWQVQLKGEATSRRVTLRQRTYAALTAALRKKFQRGSVSMTVVVKPNVLVADDDDVIALRASDVLEVCFNDPPPKK